MGYKRGCAIVFACRPDGTVLEVALDELGLTSILASGGFLASVEPSARPHAIDFLRRANDGGSLEVEELGIPLPGGRSSLFFYGRRSVNGLDIVGCTKQITQSKTASSSAGFSGRNRPGSSNRSQKTHTSVPLDGRQAKLLAFAVHDLRNPIAGILAASQYMLEDTSSVINPEQVKLLKSITFSSGLLLRLVDDILEVASIDSGLVNIDCRPTDLVALIEQNLVMNRLLGLSKGIRVNLIVDEVPSEVMADASRVSEVIDNLVTNAIKFSRPGGEVEIRISRRANMTAMSVRDEGPGIPADELASLFQPFQQNRAGQSAARRGTGLGLAIVERIVKRHGGRIEIKTNVGIGSTFTVLLRNSRGGATKTFSRQAARGGPA